jgi:hypothetical protein
VGRLELQGVLVGELPLAVFAHNRNGHRSGIALPLHQRGLTNSGGGHDMLA